MPKIGRDHTKSSIVQKCSKINEIHINLQLFDWLVFLKLVIIRMKLLRIDHCGFFCIMYFFLQNHDPFMYRFCLSSVMLAQLPGGDVVKLFFWVSFYYIFKKTKAFRFKSKAFRFYSDKFLTNQKLFVLNQKLFFFILTSFLTIKSFSF